MNNEAETSAVAVEVVAVPRLTIILHPNSSRIDIALNDRLFNAEKYSFSRKRGAVGDEKALLDYCETYIVGIGCAKASKNTLELEIDDGVLLREFIPQVVTAVKRWGSAVEPYSPSIYVDNRRYAVDPTYDRDGMALSEGVTEQPRQADIGLPYEVWTRGS